jgi:quercetin dioxygenase-like cupin family protein
MDIFTVNQLAEQQRGSDHMYLEFLRVPSLSVGLYVLPADSADPQQPHSEDEVYYVVSGNAQIRVGAEERAVAAGSVVFVAAGVEHRFHSISEELRVLVFFAPAEYSLRKLLSSRTMPKRANDPLSMQFWLCIFPAVVAGD